MKTALFRIIHLMIFVFISVVISPATYGDTYNPLTVSPDASLDILNFTVKDRRRGRDIPVRVYFLPADSSSPVIIFSHGLGGSREGSSYLGRHWAARGYIAVFLQHPGSDTSVWKNKPVSQRMMAMNEAASGRNFMLRVMDVPAVLDQLERWNGSDDHVLSGQLNLSKVGMSGHSFGAVTTQALSGQRFGRGRPLFIDERITAALIMSPSSPQRGTPQEAFGKVSIPWMLMTGTKDISLIGNADMDSRLAVFPALSAGGKYELVLYKAEHSAFSDRALPGDREARNPNHHRVILALSTAFWDTYLRDDAAARTWLHNDGPKSVMENRDRWQMK
ncbi:alpha/beta hydrolase family protein [Thermodesulfobacteriota bacterium]